MLKLIKIETFKLFKRTKTWVILIAFVLLTALIAYVAYKDNANMKKYNSPENRIAQYEEELKMLEESIPDDIKNDQEKLEEYKKSNEQRKQYIKSEIAKLKVEVEQAKNGDWKSAIKAQIEELKTQQELYKGSPEYKNMLVENEKEIERLQYLLDNNIKPEEDYAYNGRIFLSGLIALLVEIFLAMGIAVFASDMVSGEATPPTMKLLLTQPVSRGKVLLAKFISINLSAVSLIIGVELIGYLIVGIFCGFGDANYPMTV